MRNTILISLFLFSSLFSFAQQTAKVYGIVKNDKGEVMDLVSVSLEGKPGGIITGSNGFYLIDVPADFPTVVVFSYSGYFTQKMAVTLKANEQQKLDVILKSESHTFNVVHITEQREKVEGMKEVDPRVLDNLPNGSGNLEAILKTYAGVSSNNELSSQYNVRGGNYDENLVYVNDFEIYRPLLIRNGQQEGLTFANPDMISSLKFSAGGFQARYGDKMASVLDVQYKEPKAFAATVSTSLLGQSITLEGCTPNHRLTMLAGFRNKTNQILLNSQPTKGEYRPVFNDAQLYLTYDVNEKCQLHLISNLNQNKFQFVPESAVTSFGLVNQSIRLTVYYDGEEIDKFNTLMSGLSAVYRPSEKLKLKWMASAFKMDEDETFDIIGQYYIGEVETDITKPTFNTIKKSLGVGTNQDYARNYLSATVANVSHLGSYYAKNNTTSWGLTLQHELINDQLKEWKRIDSAGYSLPYSDSMVHLFLSTKSHTSLSSNRLSGFIQNSFGFGLVDTSKIKMTAGVRFNYWDLNKQLIVSPRFQFSYLPNWKRDVVFRLATGMYSQPPFYRELRDLDGIVHTNVKAQNSYQVLVGSDYHFSIWKRPFTLSGEAYYKYMTNVIPYEIDNVRIRYYGTNNAIAYATGADFRLNGEFVKDAESWISVSYLNTKENLTDDFITAHINKDGQLIDPHISNTVQDKQSVRDTTLYPGWISRPTDQRVNVGLYFSDYLPHHENFKVHLNALYGTGFKFGPPDRKRYNDTLHIPAYRRVDVGFSALLLDGKKEKNQHSKIKKHFESIWASLELFNMLGVSNTVSYLWVKDISNTSYAVPNYLTGRRVNLKLTFKIR